MARVDPLAADDQHLKQRVRRYRLYGYALTYKQPIHGRDLGEVHGEQWANDGAHFV